MQVELIPVLWPYVLKSLVGLVVAGAGAAMLYPFRKVKKEWASLKEAVTSTQAELVLQRTNCLGTLQEQGTEQIKLLSKATDTLDGIRLDLAEQTGFLRAGAVPLRRRSKKT